MIATLSLSLACASPGYALVEALREPTLSSSFERSAPNESAFDGLLLRKLGTKGWRRVQQFRTSYRSGWGDRSGRPLSPRALEAFFRFLSEFEFPREGRLPSVFLTDDGGIELSWESSDGSAVQVAFSRDRAEFFRAATGEEGCLSLDRLAELQKCLSAQHAS